MFQVNFLNFLGLLKHYKNRGFSRFLCFLFLKKKKGKKKMITGIYEFGFFWSKNGRFVTHNFFPKKIAWNPYFYSVFGCAFSGPRCQKRQFLDTLSKKNLTDNWKVLFLVFLCFLFFLSWFFFFCCFLLFFVVFLFCLFCFVFVLFLFGGFKGQVRWPKGPPHLALNPHFFVFFLFFWRV